MSEPRKVVEPFLRGPPSQQPTAQRAKHNMVAAEPMAGQAAMPLDHAGRLRSPTDARHDLRGERDQASRARSRVSSSTFSPDPVQNSKSAESGLSLTPLRGQRLEVSQQYVPGCAGGRRAKRARYGAVRIGGEHDALWLEADRF